MTYLDLDAIRRRSDDYLNIADRMVDEDQSKARAAIGFAAVLTASDVPDLLDEVERLHAELEES